MAMQREEVRYLRKNMIQKLSAWGCTQPLISVAATKTPIIFLGVGEHLHDLDRFSPQPFVSKLLGLGDIQGLVEHMQDMATQNPDKQKEMAKKLEEGKLSIRDWREQIQNVMSMGPISKIASMIPGLPQDLLAGSDEEGSLRMKRMIYITDSMTAEELDSDGSPFLEVGKDGKPTGLTWRITRVAKGSGTSVREVEELLCQYRMMANMAKQAGGKNGWLQAIQKMQTAAGGRGRGAGGMPTPAQIQAMQVRIVIFTLESVLNGLAIASDAARYAPTDATTDERWRRHTRHDEGDDAGTGRRPVRHGGDAA
jgi:signal recognition particle subunit SRP54